MLMTVGKYKGQPVEAMATSYLMWLISQDAIRFKRWPLVNEALRVLQVRFARFDDLLAELEVTRPPSDHRPTPEQIEGRRAERAGKLRKLEQRRAKEKARRSLT